MDQLLRDHPLIDRVFLADQILELGALEFDIAFVIDKSLRASGLLRWIKTSQVHGFLADAMTGAIKPANPEAWELWELGLSNQKKFFDNRKTENQLVAEALGLEYRKDEYSIVLSEKELIESRRRSLSWRVDPSQPILGFNTGCGPMMPAKKWTVEFHRQVLEDLLRAGFKNFVLLGGPEDAERNRRIAEGLPVMESPIGRGLRDGAVSVAACDLVITGDSLGMHLAIAFKRFVIAWFGPSCPQEIELFGRGIKLHADVPCSPCWKRHCQQTTMCYDRVSRPEILRAVQEGTKWWNQEAHKHREELRQRRTRELPDALF